MPKRIVGIGILALFASYAYAWFHREDMEPKRFDLTERRCKRLRAAMGDRGRWDRLLTCSILWYADGAAEEG